jgi:hypothetical protein
VNVSSGTNVTNLTLGPITTLNITGASSTTSWLLSGSQPGATKAFTPTPDVKVAGTAILVGTLGEQQASVISSAQASAVTSASAEASKSFGTDSVAQQIDYGFAGDVGVAATMAHEIPLEGETISVPSCTSESKNSTPCKK